MKEINPGTRKLPSDEVVMELIKSGQTRIQIASDYDVDAYAVTLAMRRMEEALASGPREDERRIVVTKGHYLDPLGRYRPARISLPRLSMHERYIQEAGR